MESRDDLLDLHLTHLVGWLVQTLGKAIGYGALVGGGVALLGLLADSGELVPVGAVLGLLVAGISLVSARAPFPVEPDRD